MPLVSTSIYAEYYYDVSFASSLIVSGDYQLRVNVEGSLSELDYFYL